MNTISFDFHVVAVPDHSHNIVLIIVSNSRLGIVIVSNDQVSYPPLTAVPCKCPLHSNDR